LGIGGMSEGPAHRRWFQISLRRVFAWLTITAILTEWAVSNWRRARDRSDFLGAAGAVKGHERTMQAYHDAIDRTSIKWLLFGERHVTFINLYPGTYDDDYLVQMRKLFPEAEISSSRDQNAEPQKIAD
jgi:hypothetical protein